MRKFLLFIIPLLILGAYLVAEPPSVVTRSDLDTQGLALDANSQGKALKKSPKIFLLIYPDTIIQGDPAMIVIEGVEATSMDSTSSPQGIKSLTFDGKRLGVFENNGKLTALVGIDLRAKTGSYPLVLTLSNGKVVKKNLAVGERVIAKAPLGIPEILGGDTPQAEQKLISTLVKEGTIISAVKSADEKLWSGEFRLPIDPPIIVTDVYGYTRLTGRSSISHKGTDFRAATGTPVYAANSGRVAFVDYLRNYGNTLIIDHGLGLLTVYMHLSEIDVKLGENVKRGELIARSGQTGYVLGPHLHLTVRINGISIDPMKFMALLGGK